MQSAVERFRRLAGEDRFRGWPVVGEYEDGPDIPFFGHPINYKLQTPNGLEPYTSIVRSFGWVVVFGVTKDDMVLTLCQWKPGVNCASCELPPGGIGKVTPDMSLDDIMEKTKEVYLRETGFGAGKWTGLGHVIIESGKFRGAGPDDHGLKAHLAMATDLEQLQGARQPNANEIMETLQVPLNEFPDLLRSGLFVETSAVACAYKALLRLGRLRWQ